MVWLKRCHVFLLVSSLKKKTYVFWGVGTSRSGILVAVSGIRIGIPYVLGLKKMLTKKTIQCVNLQSPFYFSCFL